MKYTGHLTYMMYACMYVLVRVWLCFFFSLQVASTCILSHIFSFNHLCSPEDVLLE